MTKRAALYLRVSTDGQTTENQRIVLEDVAQRHGWTIVRVFEDAGISGAKGRDQRPAFDDLHKRVIPLNFLWDASEALGGQVTQKFGPALPLGR